MRLHIAVPAAILVLMASSAAIAQTKAPQVTAEADPGVRLTRLIDRAEVRLSRIELQPGAVRRVHAHDDVLYHLWVPIAGSLEITIGTDAPVAATSGQAFFMKRNTMHGFRNVGATPASLFEIFIKETTQAAALESAEHFRDLLAALDPRASSEVPDIAAGTHGDDARSGPARAAALTK